MVYSHQTKVNCTQDWNLSVLNHNSVFWRASHNFLFSSFCDKSILEELRGHKVVSLCCILIWPTIPLVVYCPVLLLSITSVCTVQLVFAADSPVLEMNQHLQCRGYCDLAKLHLLHKTWFTLGSSDWIVRMHILYMYMYRLVSCHFTTEGTIFDN